jgi:hypothetical protein
MRFPVCARREAACRRRNALPYPQHDRTFCCELIPPRFGAIDCLASGFMDPIIGWKSPSAPERFCLGGKYGR